MEAEFKAYDGLTKPEKKWVSANADKYESVVPALKALGRPKKEGGGAANKNRVSKIQSEAAMLENPGSVRADTPLAIAYMEEGLLGISLTCSRIDSCDISQVNCTCREFLAGRTGFMILGVEVQTVRKVKTKKGKNPGAEMAFLTVSDSSCSLDEVVVFPETWAQYRSVLTEGNTVIMQVERDWKDKQSNSTHVQKVWQAIQGGSPLAA
jgi:DNA polymerase III alpha subunit